MITKNTLLRTLLYHIWRIPLVLILLLLPACSLIGGEADDNAFTVAVIAPLSGEFAPLGQAVRNGVLLAVEIQNANGGVLGRPVKVALHDSGCDYETARDAALQAVEEEQVLFILGAVCGDASEGVAQVASELSVLQISPASVNPELTLDYEEQLRPLVFRVPFIDPDQGTVAARFARDRLNVESAAIISAEGSAYGRTLADAFVAAFTEDGGQIVARQQYAQADEAFYDMLAEVAESDPDLLYMPGYYPQINELVTQTRLYGLLQVIIGSDGWDSPELKLTHLDGCYFTSHYAPDEPRSAVQAWTQLYEARYLVPPDVLATLGYDAANMLFMALATTGSDDPLLVAQTMEQMTFDLVSGWMKFDARHNPVKSVLVKHIVRGNVGFEARIFAREISEDAESEE